MCLPNCIWMLAWASTVRLSALIGTLNSRLQSVQTATTGVELSHLTTLRLRSFGALFFSTITVRSQLSKNASFQVQFRLLELWF